MVSTWATLSAMKPNAAKDEDASDKTSVLNTREDIGNIQDKEAPRGAEGAVGLKTCVEASYLQ